MTDSTASKRSIHGLDFAYETHGEGTPVVFLHGLPADRRSMAARFEPMFVSTKGWRRIYVDLPGMGETPGAPNIRNVDEYLAEVSAFIDAETEGERVALVAQSWGAAPAFAYTRTRSERVAGIALVVPFLDHPTKPAAQVLASEPGVFDGFPPPLTGAVSRVATVHTRKVRDWIKDIIVPAAQRADRKFLDAAVPPPLALREDLRELRFDGPALVVAGRQDSVCGYVGARELSERLPRATYAVLDRAGHALGVEQDALFSALVLEWLGRVREGLGGGYDAPAP